MMERVKEQARVAWHWLIAGLIATSIASAGLSLIYSQYNQRQTHVEKPCAQRACFAQLEVRISSLETEIRARTENRYTSQDAERDHRLMLSVVQKQAREIAVLKERLDLEK